MYGGVGASLEKGCACREVTSHVRWFISLSSGSARTRRGAEVGSCPAFREVDRNSVQRLLTARTAREQTMLRARIAAQLHKQPLLDSSRRCLHSSGSSIAAQIASSSILHRRARLSSTPAWSEESLAAVRDKYEQKYAARLQQKARECVD